MSLDSRTDYTKGTLNEESLGNGPWPLFEEWVKAALKQAFRTDGIHDHCGCEGIPAAHRVPRDTQTKLVFYTNCLSEKGAI